MSFLGFLQDTTHSAPSHPRFPRLLRLSPCRRGGDWGRGRMAEGRDQRDGREKESGLISVVERFWCGSGEAARGFATGAARDRGENWGKERWEGEMGFGSREAESIKFNNWWKNWRRVQVFDVTFHRCLIDISDLSIAAVYFLKKIFFDHLLNIEYYQRTRCTLFII